MGISDRHIHPQLTQRMPQYILDMIAEYAEDRGISRSKAINEATEFYAESKTCMLCGSVNNGDGKICSCCGSELFTDDEIEKAILDLTTPLLYDDSKVRNKEVVNTILSKSEEYKKLGLDVITSPVIDRATDEVKYSAEVQVQTPSGDILTSRSGDSSVSFDAGDIYQYLKKSKGIIPIETEKVIKEILFKYREDSIRDAKEIAETKKIVDAFIIQKLKEKKTE